MAYFRYYGKNKYGNRKTVVDNITFDSRHEANRYIELKFQQNAGIIHDLTLQKKYVLIEAQYESSDEVYQKGANKGKPKRGALIEREVAYYADFDYYTADGEHVVEDAKGLKTKEYVIKRKLMLKIHGIRIHEIF